MKRDTLGELKMEITHLGLSCFRLKGKHASGITDPFDPGMVGIKLAQQVADWITISHQHADHNFIEAVTGSPVIIDGPGEYEVKGVRIVGVPTFHDDVRGEKRGKNTMYYMEMDGISIVHCGDLGHQLDEKQKETVAEPDILLVPVGGTYSLSSREASQLVSILSPKMVIPMHYQSSGLNQETFQSLTGVDVFLKEMGKEGITPQPKLSITKDKLPSELTVVVLE